MASNAVSANDISRIVGYQITKGNFQNTSPNLPQSIAVLAEANEANQASLSLTPQKITSAQQAGSLYGYGSPIYLIARILFPVLGGSGVNGVPVWVYPQAKAIGATNKVIEINATGVATGNGTHFIKIAGRDGLDGDTYAINIEAGDNASTISNKITDAVNNVLGCPMIAYDSIYSSILTSKWKGLTANDLNVTVDTDGNALGITYSVENNVQAGSGTPSVAAALELFGTQWNTIVINSYGLVSTVMNSLEAYNGIPEENNPTGRYKAIIMKPFIALSGSSLDDPSTLTDARLNNVTIAVCPCPGSAGLPFEAAANACVRLANVAQDTPQLDIAGKTYPDMPTPTSIGSMMNYDSRNNMVKAGSSTVDLVTGQYVIQDFITTYHPVGENPPQFRYVRNLIIDFNVRFAYYLLEQKYVVDHTIASDDDVVSAAKVVKPKMWKQVLNALADDLANRGLIVDADFMKNSIVVNVSTSNPDRFETYFKYKRSGFVRVASTTAEAGFNFGTLNS